MKQHLALLWTCFASGLVCAHGLPQIVAESQKERTALPLLFLLSLPQLGAPSLLPGIPLRRPQDETTAKPILSDELPQDEANALIREQFIQGVLQGLQAAGGSGSGAGPSTAGAISADSVLSELEALIKNSSTTTTATPRITSPPTEKEAPQAASIDDSDPDYDYIDFKHGSRIKYDLETVEGAAQYPNKILQAAAAPTIVGYYRVA